MRKNFRIGEDYSGAGFWGWGNFCCAEEKQVLRFAEEDDSVL